MQTLAEDRWEDYEWQYGRGRFAYWGSGISWIEDPTEDALGLEGRMCQDTMSTIPYPGADTSYYLRPVGPQSNDIIEAPPESKALESSPCVGEPVMPVTQPIVAVV
jgi:hypothetical protein